jgi:hypothetical protein
MPAKLHRRGPRFTEAFTAYFDPADLRALRDVREHTGVPLSVLLRRAVRVVLEQHGRAATNPETSTP